MATKEEILVWNGTDFISVEDMVKAEIKTTLPITPKEVLARDILQGLLMVERGKIVGTEYHRIATEVKAAHGVRQGPSLDWMKSQGYMHNIKVEGRMTFWAVTKAGVEFQEAEPEAENETLEESEE